MWLMATSYLPLSTPVNRSLRVGDDEVGPHIQLAGQQLAQFDFEAGEFAVILEIEGRCISLKGNAQFATVVDIVNQFGMSQRAQKG